MKLVFLELKYKHVRCMEFDTVDNLKLLKKHSGFFKFYSGIDIEHIPASKDEKRLWNIKDNGDYEFVTVFGIKGRIEYSRRVIKENEQIISELNRAIAFFSRKNKLAIEIVRWLCYHYDINTTIALSLLERRK